MGDPIKAAVEADAKSVGERVETKLDALLVKLEAPVKTWYEKHVTGIVGIGCLILGGLIVHAFHL